MHKYSLQFILSTQNILLEDLKVCLSEYGEDLEVFQVPQIDSERANNFRIQITTLDPTIIFDACSQFGRLKSVKIDER